VFSAPIKRSFSTKSANTGRSPMARGTRHIDPKRKFSVFVAWVCFAPIVLKNSIFRADHNLGDRWQPR
jgi:hypothetical protein